MKDNHNLYLKCDVLLLADVLEKFRDGCLENYILCSNHYLSGPALSWDTMLSMTEVELDLISDVGMYLFFEKGMRGGVSYISKRHSKANKHVILKNQQNILPTSSKMIYTVVLFTILLQRAYLICWILGGWVLEVAF